MLLHCIYNLEPVFNSGYYAFAYMYTASVFKKTRHTLSRDLNLKKKKKSSLLSQLLIHNIKYRKLRKLCARIYETSRCLLQDMTISIVKCLLKNIYICTVYTIFADYLFPCKWLSVSITGFRTDYFVYPRSFFLVHLTRKTQKKGTVHDIVGQLLVIILQVTASVFTVNVIYFCIAKKIFI